jgi:hypothetical protein
MDDFCVNFHSLNIRSEVDKFSAIDVADVIKCG